MKNSTIFLKYFLNVPTFGNKNRLEIGLYFSEFLNSETLHSNNFMVLYISKYGSHRALKFTLLETVKTLELSINFTIWFMLRVWSAEKIPLWDAKYLRAVLISGPLEDQTVKHFSFLTYTFDLRNDQIIRWKNNRTSIKGEFLLKEKFISCYIDYGKE